MRGVFQRKDRPGQWWINWYDHLGKQHRERAGFSAVQAKALYEKRKHDVALAKYKAKMQSPTF